ncbi:MAG: hypothetical protein WCJ32_03865 [Actinomycetota bacterium]|jgi:hypothetical protein
MTEDVQVPSAKQKLRTSQIVTRTAVIVSVLFIIGMWVYAYGFATRQAGAKISDVEWTKRAEQICIQRNGLLEKNADAVRKITDGSPQAVGRGVAAATDIIEVAQNKIMEELPTVALDLELVNKFDELYRVYISDRRATEIKLASGEEAELNETMLSGSPVSATIADFTRPNLMNSCSVQTQY